ncbi:MAG: Phosphoglycerate kinase [Parcubacteria group bacterium Gr01-1014_72]|nr:MAG: Phosphoglycerate kinase [Parcubacteria group bacterium Gr01-1014_72]
MKTIRDIPTLRNRTVLLRLDLNVPIVGGAVRDDFRIRKILPTLSLLRERGAKVLVVSHIEGAGGTLRPVFEYLTEVLHGECVFLPEYFSERTKQLIAASGEGSLFLFENVRRERGETENDEGFARRLASLAELYVNDAFAVSHRAHASVVGVPRFLPSFAGPLFEEEVRNLSRAFHPPRPFLFALGGAKFETKLPLIEKFLGLADTVFIGGALANNFFAARGLEVGRSTVGEAGSALRDIIRHEKIMLPVDVVVESPTGARALRSEDVAPDEAIMDAGPQTVSLLGDLLSESAFVLWNGPLGNYERGFTSGTEELAARIAESRTESIIGGGDTLASIAAQGLLEKFSFVSTGGGAMLQFLADETLPGLEALKHSR